MRMYQFSNAYVWLFLYAIFYGVILILFVEFDCGLSEMEAKSSRKKVFDFGK